VTRPRIDVLYVDGCPNHAGARDLLERVVRELRLNAEVRSILVRDQDEAQALRFPGSPTIRVNGRDVEPGPEQRSAFGLACRIYPGGRLEEAWLREALEPW
jgi:hypothetical protein